MNAARRNRQKDNRENAHEHLNRAARTAEDGTVTPCLFCRPKHHANEKVQTHGGLRFRPVTGSLSWAQRAVDAVAPAPGMSQQQAAERLNSLRISGQDTPPGLGEADSA